uniref:Uncharacterized protein n=1 Tax=Salix viminalis TaxID=40686 RepID=A0A6N2KRW1_SALVM
MNATDHFIGIVKSEPEKYIAYDSDDFKNLIQPLQEVARKFISKIMFVYIDIADENQAKPFLTLLGIEDSENTVKEKILQVIVGKTLDDLVLSSPKKVLLEVKLSTKSTSRDLATTIKSLLKAKMDFPKDEL